MKSCVTSAVLLAVLVLGFGVSARAQDPSGGKPEPEKGEEEAEPKRPPPSAGALPVEDPTIHRERKQEIGQVPPDEAEQRPDAETREQVEAESAVDDDPTAGALPVEDPTIQEPVEEREAEEEEPADVEPEAGAAVADWGKPVKVTYGYQGGLLVAVDDWFYLAMSGLLQARYAVNYRTKPPTDPETGVREKQVAQGFDVARARFHLGVGLTEFVALYMRIGVVAGGDFSFQRAFIDLKWKYFRLRAGLFMNELIAEELINPNDLYFNDYSIVDNVFSPGSSKGIMFTYLRKRFSINLGYSDGLRTGFSEVRAATRADFAVTLRTQYAWGERGLSGFNRLIARRGTPFGVRLGGAIHYQDGGRSQGTAPVKIALGTLDLSVRGNGWSLLFSATTGQDASTGSNATENSFAIINSGLSIVGGAFVLEDLQVFAQYAVVPKPRIQGEVPPDGPNLLTDQLSPFHSFGVGLSFFVIPGHDNVKLSTDFQYFLGRTLGSTVPASPLNNIQPNDDGSQFFWRIQLSAAF